ncbi:hypothetical protein D3C81_2007250 [compost metagenome]
MEVEVNLRALVLVGFERGEISGLTLIIPGGIGGARDGAVHTHADLFAFQLIDRHDVNLGQKRG